MGHILHRHLFRVENGWRVQILQEMSTPVDLDDKNALIQAATT